MVGYNVVSNRERRKYMERARDRISVVATFDAQAKVLNTGYYTLQWPHVMPRKPLFKPRDALRALCELR